MTSGRRDGNEHRRRDADSAQVHRQATWAASRDGKPQRVVRRLRRRTLRCDVASDAELDSQYGDPEIKYDPKEKWWTGASFVGRTFSRCSPEYLDAYAKSCEARAYAISKDPEGDPKKAGYAAKDARLARGWAARVRANPPKVKKPSPPPDHDDMDQSDIPF